MSRVVQIRAWNSTHAWQRGSARSLRSSTATPCVRATRCDFLRFSFVEVLGRESTLESFTRLTSMLQVPACTYTHTHTHIYRYICVICKQATCGARMISPSSSRRAGSYIHTRISRNHHLLLICLSLFSNFQIVIFLFLSVILLLSLCPDQLMMSHYSRNSRWIM